MTHGNTEHEPRPCKTCGHQVQQDFRKKSWTLVGTPAMIRLTLNMILRANPCKTK
jgi:hypothetical protein